MTQADPNEELNPREAYLQYTRSELDQIRKGLDEISLLVAQSQGEVDKLAQRNANITAQLRQVQAQFDTLPREDIRRAYENAQDTQQRLYTMRGQLEKLQSDKLNLKRYQDFLIRTLSVMEGGISPDIVHQDRTEIMSMISKIIEAQEEERRKISRQIHDGPAQALSNFILQTEIAVRLFDVDQEQARKELDDLKNTASATFAKVRDFIFDLRPMMLDDLGLVPTVRRYTEAFKEKTGLDISLVPTGTERRLQSHLEVLAFRAIQDALAHVRDHAQATKAEMTLFMDEQEIRVAIKDNGKGYSLSDDGGPGEETLAALRDRIAQVGGEFVIEPQADGGTKVAFSIPI